MLAPRHGQSIAQLYKAQHTEHWPKHFGGTLSNKPLPLTSGEHSITYKTYGCRKVEQTARIAWSPRGRSHHVPTMCLNNQRHSHLGHWNPLRQCQAAVAPSRSPQLWHTPLHQGLAQAVNARGALYHVLSAQAWHLKCRNRVLLVARRQP
jgi:hypothetical protein